VAIYSGDDRRRLIPLALVQVLTCLIDETGDEPSAARVELRSVRTRLCKVFGIADPAAPANASALAQEMEEADGVPQDY